ncbi:MAG: hypothetical protein B0W54_05310 [Cellvibrio sp. 79]|nr:MAG: hypothetical protein B0W54_05310 [Cellvibrio sp. 79]
MNSTVESRLYKSVDGNVSEQELQQRYHYLDNLRALAMIAGVLFHASLAYSSMLHGLWISADSQQSSAVDVVGFFTHLFRMPLFFLIAGFFAAYLVAKRGMGGFIANRAKRVLLPLIVFLPLCLWAVVAAMLSAANTVENKSPVLAMVAKALANPADAPPPPPPTTMHLWFLYVLVFLYLLTWAFGYLNWSSVREKVIQIKPLAFLLGFPLLLMPGLLLVGSPLPAPDSFLPQLWAFGFFGLFFAVGYWMFKGDNLVEKISSYWWLMLIGSVFLYVLYYQLIPKRIVLPAPPIETHLKIVLKLCEAYIAVWMTLVCLVLGKRYLNGANRNMRFMADSSYWIYIIHVPLLFAIQYQLMDLSWGWLTKFAVSVIATLTIGVLSYTLLVRWTPIGWMLNGRRK